MELNKAIVMNRHTRRANEKAGTDNDAPVSPQAPVATNRPGLLLRVFAGILLTRWVIKRVQHPDVLVIMRQLAQQTGRADAAELLSAKLRAFTH